MSAAAGAAAASAAAAARRAKEREEEEHLTMYNNDDLNQEWEFKIVRSSVGAFKNPDKLRQLMMEESQAGWTFLEKFDDNRVRFRRPRSAAQSDSLAGFDPYRTNFGMSEGML
ncbi:MAG: hypothetical protein ACM3ZQ_09525, partial [Bacillota bacterium]